MGRGKEEKNKQREKGISIKIEVCRGFFFPLRDEGGGWRLRKERGRVQPRGWHGNEWAPPCLLKELFIHFPEHTTGARRKMHEHLRGSEHQHQNIGYIMTT